MEESGFAGSEIVGLLHCQPKADRKLSNGDVAQLGERRNGIAEVDGSIPFVSTIFMNPHDEQIAHASKLALIGQLTAGIAHELRNPLAAIRLSVDEIDLIWKAFKQDNTDPKTDISPFLEDITRNIYKMVEIIEQVYQISHKPDNTFKKLNLHEIFQDINKILKKITESNKITLTSELKATNPTFYGNSTRMEHILLNIITNAVEAIVTTGKKGNIWFRTFSDKVSQGISIEIEDDGPGIDEKHRGTIFDPFFTTKEVGKGLGLGLSITAETILAHSGTITADSHFGKGTIFKIWLPHDRREIARMKGDSPKQAHSQKL